MTKYRQLLFMNKLLQSSRLCQTFCRHLQSFTCGLSSPSNKCNSNEARASGAASCTVQKAQVQAAHVKCQGHEEKITVDVMMPFLGKPWLTEHNTESDRNRHLVIFYKQHQAKLIVKGDQVSLPVNLWVVHGDPVLAQNAIIAMQLNGVQ